jgi:AAA domain
MSGEPSVSYRRLEAEQGRRAVRDHSTVWHGLTPLDGVNGTVRERVEFFARAKRISVEALEALGARVVVRRSGEVQLAFAGENGAGTVTAIKYRPLDGSSHDSTAEPSSIWLRPIVVGKLDSLVWLVAEGETDGARLFDLVGDRAAILVLPAGARTFKPEWAELIPRGATVALCHDADEDGDRGAEKAARIIGGRALRIRPPVEGGDWCDWSGDREALLKLLAAAASAAEPVRLEALTTRAIAALPDPPDSDQLLGPLVVRGQRTIIGAHTGEGKTTKGLAVVAAVTEQRDFLGWQGAGGRALVIDLEQGLRTVKRRIREAGLDASENVDYVRVPDGLALDRESGHVAAVEELLEAGGYDLVYLDPLYKAHRGDSNEEQAQTAFMRRLDGWRDRHGFALLLSTHCRKPPPGQRATLTIHDLFGSSAIVRGAEIVIGLQRLRDGYSRLHFLKDRDGDLPIGDRWGLLFDREHGFRRDPDDEKPSTAEQVAELRAADPTLTQKAVAEAIGVTERTIRKYWSDDAQESLLEGLDDE